MPAFVLAKNPTRTVKAWPVDIPVSVDGGKVITSNITVDFLVLPQDQIDERIGNVESPNVDSAIVCDVVSDWSGIVDENGASVPFSPESLAVLAAMPNVRSAVLSAYFGVCSGRGAQKN